MFVKNTRIRAPNLLANAKGKPCMKCGRNDGTVVAAHYCGLGAHRLGRGSKVKPLLIIKSKSPFAGSAWRVIDRRLQALRKAGIIKYNRADCRWCVNKSTGAD